LRGGSPGNPSAQSIDSASTQSKTKIDRFSEQSAHFRSRKESKHGRMTTLRLRIKPAFRQIKPLAANSTVQTIAAPPAVLLLSNHQLMPVSIQLRARAHPSGADPARCAET
jgi:hypothetical protein